MFWHSVKYQLTINVKVYLWTINSYPLIYVSFCQYHCLEYSLFAIRFEIRTSEFSNLFFLIQIVLTNLVPWNFPSNFRNTVNFWGEKKATWYSDRDEFWGYCHFNDISSCPYLGMLFYLFSSNLTSLNNDFLF